MKAWRQEMKVTEGFWPVRWLARRNPRSPVWAKGCLAAGIGSMEGFSFITTLVIQQTFTFKEQPNGTQNE